MPPETVADKAPLLPPKQLTFSCVSNTIESGKDSAMTAVADDVHPNISVTVTEYVPDDKKDTLEEVLPPGDHK